MRVLSLREAGQGIRFLYRGDNGAEYGNWVQGSATAGAGPPISGAGAGPCKKNKAHTAEMILLGEGEQNAMLRPCGQFLRLYLSIKPFTHTGVKNDRTKCDRVIAPITRAPPRPHLVSLLRY